MITNQFSVFIRSPFFPVLPIHSPLHTTNESWDLPRGYSFLPAIGEIEYRSPSPTKLRSGSLGLLSLVSPAEKVQVLVVAQAPQRLPSISLWAHILGHRRAHILAHTCCTPAVWLRLAPVLPRLHVERAHKPSVVWRIPLRLHAERVQQPSPLAPVLLRLHAERVQRPSPLAPVLPRLHVERACLLLHSSFDNFVLDSSFDNLSPWRAKSELQRLPRSLQAKLLNLDRRRAWTKNSYSPPVCCKSHPP
jgi:hypothetical protein